MSATACSERGLMVQGKGIGWLCGELAVLAQELRDGWFGETYVIRPLVY